MALSNNKVILIFGFNGEEQKSLSELAATNDLPKFKFIDESMAKMKVKNIVEGIKLTTENRMKEKEKVILFNNLEDDELEKCITVFKDKFQNVIFAVTTPTSIEWTFEKLLKNLIEEKRWAESRRQN